MARKKLTKKTNKVSVKLKRKAKVTSLTVVQILKRLPKQIKKELTVLKKHANKLMSSLKKAEKKKRKIDTGLTKKTTTKQLAIAKKAYHQINQTIAKLMQESAVVDQATTFLMKKQDAIIALSSPMASRPSKAKNTMLREEAQKKRAKKLKVSKQAESIDDITDTAKAEDEPTGGFTPALDTDS